MYVPDEETAEARWIRFHELLHARLSSANAPIDNSAQVTEDARIQYLAREAIAARNFSTFKEGKAPISVNGVAHIYVARRGSPMAASATRWAKRLLPEPIFRELTQMLRCAEAHPHFLPYWDAVADFLRRLRTLPSLPPGSGTPHGREGNGWGTLFPSDPPLPFKVKHHAPRQRPTEDGARIGRIDRLLTDRKCFTRRQRSRRVAPVNVLLDASGSMRLTVDAIVRMLEMIPAVRTVQSYASDGVGMSTGYLRTLARNGRYTRDVYPAGHQGGNVVDGPALRALAALPGRRIWVSDGDVTGVGENDDVELRREVRDICRAAAITRVTTIDDALICLLK